MYLRRATPAEIEGCLAEPAAAESFFFADECEEHEHKLIEFDKAWQALHFMLTGQAYGAGHPLGIIADETPFVSTGALGSFSFSVITPARLRTFADALAAIDDAELAARYDPQAMVDAEVYQAEDFLDEGSDALDYIMQGVPALRTFAAGCAAAGDGALRVLA